jgi:ribosomal protein S18 acetylase RimI-like enzyme
LADFDDVLDTLVASHLDYVWEQWAVPADDRFGRLKTLNRLSLEVMAFPNNEVWMTDDAASVCFWLPNRGVLPTPEMARQADELAAEALGHRWQHLAEVEQHLDRYRPAGHWLLASVGTRPRRRRQGLAKAVLRPCLDHLDAIGQQAVLETSSIGNLRLYERLGFEVSHKHIGLPHGAPDTWTMCRQPTLPV